MTSLESLHVGALRPVLAQDRPDLLAPGVLAALTHGAGDPGRHPPEGWGVVEIDADLSDTAAFAEAYEVPLTASANCVLVAGRREGVERIAACVVRADTRADVNGVVKRLLDVRKASFLPSERAVSESGMEYGGITPVGLPSGWRVLVDARVADLDVAVLGAGVRRAKLLAAGSTIAAIPRAEVVDGLAR